MNAQSILQKIEEDARLSAEQLLKDAARKAEETEKDSNAKVFALHEQTLKQAAAESVAQADRMRRMAELEGRKKLLEKKRQVMDEAFAAALRELCDQPAEKSRAFFLQSVCAAAQGDEALLVGANRDGWFDEGFVAEANQKLNGKLTLKSGRRENVTGVALLRGGTEVYVTYESLLQNARIQLETEIANILFNE